jgi:hypothetical protein
MIRRPVTAKTILSRIKSGNYNKNSIGSISLENYIGGKKTKKQKYKYIKKGGDDSFYYSDFPAIPGLDSSKLNVFSNIKTKLVNIIPFH